MLILWDNSHSPSATKTQISLHYLHNPGNCEFRISNTYIKLNAVLKLISAKIYLLNVGTF